MSWKPLERQTPSRGAAAFRCSDIMYWSTRAVGDTRSKMAKRKSNCSQVLFVLAALASILMSGCDVERRKSDAELGLNSQQSAGRKIYDSQCDRCHEPYSRRGKKGPSLHGVFQNKYLSLSGLPANDDRVTDIVRLGRNEMPGYSQTLSRQDIDDLLAYLHTL
jgi:mono/diheme cytochrome c family protein